MSASLLRRGLELLGAPEGETGGGGRAAGCGSASPGYRGGPCAPLRSGSASLDPLAGPETAPGPAQASGAAGKRAKRRAKAAQAQQQLRNSAKGKVPKSALGEPGKGLLISNLRGYRGAGLRRWPPTHPNAGREAAPGVPAGNEPNPGPGREEGGSAMEPRVRAALPGVVVPRFSPLTGRGLEGLKQDQPRPQRVFGALPLPLGH